MNNDKLFYTGLVIFIIIILGILAVQPVFEAATFNKLTNGAEATYWDALFSNLRITGCN